METPEILEEDDSLIVCVKPAGMPSQSDKSLSRDVVGYFKTKIKEEALRGGKPCAQEPYVVPVHRLDRPVGGILVLAKTPQAAAALSAQLQDGTMKKYYQAVLCGSLPDYEGTFEDFMVRDAKTNLSRVCAPGQKGAKRAVLHYEVLDELTTDRGTFTYALIALETGRHHQIRCQMAHHKVPVYGDAKYNPSPKGPRQIGLIATRLEFRHPVSAEPKVYKVEPWGDAFEVLDAVDY